MGNGPASASEIGAGAGAPSDAVVDAVSSVLIGLDGRGRVLVWNQAAEQRTGWTREEAAGIELESLLGPSPELRAALTAATRGMRRELTSEVTTRDGAPRRMRWQIVPLPPGSIAAVLMTGVDVTAQATLEARAAEAEAMAAMGRLTSSLAHEIKNPLNSATLQLEVLRRQVAKLPEANGMVDRLERVRAELGRLTRLLDDFMGLARPQELTLRLTDLAPAVEAVANLQRRSASEAGIAIELELEEVPPIAADEGRIRQALMDLVANAIDALRERGTGRIQIRLAPCDEGVELTVADDGPGLPQPSDELLRPFVTTKTTGTGLGLPIVSKIATLHGGRLTIGPGTEGGTLARMVLPRDGAA